MNRQQRRQNGNQSLKENTQAAQKVAHIINFADSVFANNADKRTVLSRKEMAAATYSYLVVHFNNKQDNINQFLINAIGPHDSDFESLFEFFYNVGYAAAIGDVKTQKITI